MLVEPGHVHFQEIQFSEVDGGFLLDERLDFPYLDTHQLLIKDFEAHSVWLFGHLLPLQIACHELDESPLLLILSCLPVYRVVPQLEEHPFDVGLRSCAQRRVLLEIRGEPALAASLKMEDPVTRSTR